MAESRRTLNGPIRLLLLLALPALACSLFVHETATPPPVPTLLTTTLTAPPVASATLAPATLTSAPPATAAPGTGSRLRPEDVTFHPDPQLYSGDIVSLEISAQNADPAWQEAPVNVYAGSLASQPLGTAKFERFGIGGRAQATFTWVWDTAGLVGPQDVIVTIGPAANSLSPEPLDVLTLTVELLPAEQRPMPEPVARWERAESDCCVFHYLTGTAADRDIQAIKTEADAAFDHVTAALGVPLDRKVVFNLLSRLLGHGGFAADEVSLTYIDRNPAGSSLANVFVHEGTHILDRKIAKTRPVLMTEGMAVYVAGGHFKPENLEARATALLALDRYIPLAELANDFYPAQHEIGYLEGGAFIDYLVSRFGWDRVRVFYGSFHTAPSEAEMLDAALRANFSQSLSELEADWLEHLRAQAADPAEVDDLRLTILLFDTLRRYQQLNDPSAYFLSAWLPQPAEARRRGIVADFLRHPQAPENVALETMLADAGRALAAGDFARAERLLDSVNTVLDHNNLFLDSLADDYLQIVTDLAAEGFEVQTITLDGAEATVTAIHTWPALETLSLMRTAAGWE